MKHFIFWNHFTIIFDEPSLIHKTHWFSSRMLIFGQKACFLGSKPPSMCMNLTLWVTLYAFFLLVCHRRPFFPFQTWYIHRHLLFFRSFFVDYTRTCPQSSGGESIFSTFVSIFIFWDDQNDVTTLHLSFHKNWYIRFVRKPSAT